MKHLLPTKAFLVAYLVCGLLISTESQKSSNLQGEFDGFEGQYPLEFQKDGIDQYSYPEESVDAYGDDGLFGEMDLQDGIRSENMTSHSSTGKKPPFYVNNLYAPYIQVSADMTIFMKTTKAHWESVISSQPMKRGFITQIDIKMITSDNMHCGFTEKHTQALSRRWIGGIKNGASYGTIVGRTYSLNGAQRPYGPRSSAGDVLTSKIDLREGHFTIEFLKNGHSMGLAFAGLQDWNEKIYWGASLYHLGSAFQILAIREYKQ